MAEEQKIPEGEWLDLYDWEGHPLGRRVLRGSPKCPEEFRLVMEIWIFDRQGRILMQRRSMTKKILPGAWSPTTGFAQAGESALVGACREVEEELGIRVMPEELHLAEHRRSRELGTLCDVFFLFRDFAPEDVTIQEEELSEVRWMTMEEIEELIRTGQTYSYPGMTDHLRRGGEMARSKE